MHIHTDALSRYTLKPWHTDAPSRCTLKQWHTHAPNRCTLELIHLYFHFVISVLVLVVDVHENHNFLTICSLFLNSLRQFHQLFLKPMHSNLSHYIPCKLSHLATQGRHVNLYKKLQHSDQGKTSNLNCAQWIKDTICVPSLFVLQASYRSQNHQDKKKSTIQIPYSGRSTFTSMSSWSLYSFLHSGVSWKETVQIPHSGRLHTHSHPCLLLLPHSIPSYMVMFPKEKMSKSCIQKLHIHSHVFFFLLTLFLITWGCFPEEKLSKSCILEGSTFSTMSSSFSLYSLLHGGASSPLGNLICVCGGAGSKSSRK